MSIKSIVIRTAKKRKLTELESSASAGWNNYIIRKVSSGQLQDSDKYKSHCKFEKQKYERSIHYAKQDLVCNKNQQLARLVLKGIIQDLIIDHDSNTYLSGAEMNSNSTTGNTNNKN